MSVFMDTSENFHPYECDGPGKCRHCDRRKDDSHDPATCALCAPYDHGPPPPTLVERVWYGWLIEPLLDISAWVFGRRR